jgi:hypothetical protein
MDLHFCGIGTNLWRQLGVLWGVKMHLDKVYAGYLISAANIYAAQRATPCKEEESWLEQSLLRLFEEAQGLGVEVQDIAVIASAAIAVVLTRSSASDSAKRNDNEKHIRMVKSA